MGNIIWTLLSGLPGFWGEIIVAIAEMLHKKY